MFGQRKTLRRRHSQALSVRRRGVYFFFLAFALLGFFHEVHAQTAATTQAIRQVQEQQQPPQSTQLTPTLYEYKKPSMFDFTDFMRNFHANYNVSLMGPRMSGSSDETYNIYFEDVAPIQLFHGWAISYQATPDFKVGASISAPQNLTKVIGNTGVLYNPSFTFFDPKINFDFPNLFQNSVFSIYSSAAFSLPVTQASQDVGRITTLTFTQSWTVKNYPSDWSYGFNLFFEPLFYTEPIPAEYAGRQTMIFAFGHFLSYRVSKEFSVGTSTNINYDHVATPTGDSLTIGTNLPDTMRVSCSILPNVYPAFLSIGGYLQAILWNPSPDTTIIGADFSIGF